MCVLYIVLKNLFSFIVCVFLCVNVFMFNIVCDINLFGVSDVSSSFIVFAFFGLSFLKNFNM